MTKVAVALAGLLLVAIAAACGDGGGAPGGSQEDAASVLHEAHTAMSDLDSFRAVMTIEAEEGSFDFTMEWQRPDRFRVVIPWEEREDEAVGETGVSEGIAIGYRAYSRQCKAEGEDCSEWSEADWIGVRIPTLTPSFDPHWPIVALGLILDGEIVGEEELDGVPSIHVAGKVNQLRAIYQTLEESLRQQGVTTYGRECTASPGEPEECRDVPVEEFMENQADDIRREDENPAPADVWIGRDDGLLRRFATGSLPDNLEQATIITMTFTYSRFDQVDIREPE